MLQHNTQLWKEKYQKKEEKKKRNNKNIIWAVYINRIEKRREKNREEDENPIMSEQENHSKKEKKEWESRRQMGLYPLPRRSEPKAPHSSDYASYSNLYPNDVTPTPASISVDAATTMPPEFNPFIYPNPAPRVSWFSSLWVEF